MIRRSYLLFTAFLILSLAGVAAYFQSNIENRIALEKASVVNQARLLFDNVTHMRQWNALHGGVYVQPKITKQPNPYLKNGTIKTQEGPTLIKINPAWMTRQLSESLENQGFSFRITSLKPLNPNNIPTEEERTALKAFELEGIKEYFTFLDNDTRLFYMAPLKVEAECMQCHAEQGYSIGDIRGGISVTVNNDHFERALADIDAQIRKNWYGVAVFTALLFFFFHLWMRRLAAYKKLNTSLEETIATRTDEIRRTQELFQGILNVEKSMLVLLHHDEVLFANQTFLGYLGYDDIESLTRDKRNIWEIFEAHPDCQSPVYRLEDLIEMNHRDRHCVAMHNRLFEMTLKTFTTRHGVYHLLILDDITEIVEHQKHLTAKAHTDALTGVGNRTYFDAFFVELFRLSNTNDEPLSMIFFDIDFFKRINDDYGHDVGDLVLKNLATYIKNSIRASDFIARWGGEEFVVLLPKTTAATAKIVAEKIRTGIGAAPIVSDITVTLSAGITQAMKADTPQSMLKRSDQAMYQAKTAGRNQSWVL